MELLQPEGWAPPKGFANGVAASGRLVCVAGQVGWDPATATFATDDFVAQARQALANVVAVVAAAGGGPQHIVRMTWFVTDKRAYQAAAKDLGTAYRGVMGRHFPAMTLVEVKSLLEPRAQVEIEATAVVP